jgi:hypothetical protein
VRSPEILDHKRNGCASRPTRPLLADFGLFTRDARSAHGGFSNPADDKTVHESQFCAVAFPQSTSAKPVIGKIVPACKRPDDSRKADDGSREKSLRMCGLTRCDGRPYH